MKHYLYALFVSLTLTAFDVVTKLLVVMHLHPLDRIDYLGGFLRLSLVYNQGGVFGIMQGKKTFFLIASIIVLIVILIYYIIIEKHKTRLLDTAMAMIIGGAIGNITDRLISGRPGVVDFISIGVDGIYRWPSFNVADSSIVVGAFLLAIFFFREEKRRKKLDALGAHNEHSNQ